jgi:hypothetical protein
MGAPVLGSFRQVRPPKPRMSPATRRPKPGLTRHGIYGKPASPRPQPSQPCRCSLLTVCAAVTVFGWRVCSYTRRVRCLRPVWAYLGTRHDPNRLIPLYHGHGVGPTGPRYTTRPCGPRGKENGISKARNLGELAMCPCRVSFLRLPACHCVVICVVLFLVVSS